MCYDRIALFPGDRRNYFLCLFDRAGSDCHLYRDPPLNSPGSLLGVSKNRYVIAIVVASLELIGWLFFASVLIFHHK